MARQNAAKTARIIYGNISYDAEDADNAIMPCICKALDDFNQASALKNILLSGLGICIRYERRNIRSPYSYFEMISTENDKTLKSDALFNLAWLYDDNRRKGEEHGHV
jgi:hypothetical protein